MDKLILGIDLGTTNSLVGVVDSGFPILLADENGRRLTPSAVYLPEEGPEVVGEAALRMRPVAPDRVVTSIKRLIGLQAKTARVLRDNAEIDIPIEQVIVEDAFDGESHSQDAANLFGFLGGFDDAGQ